MTEPAGRTVLPHTVRVLDNFPVAAACTVTAAGEVCLILRSGQGVDDALRCAGAAFDAQGLAVEPWFLESIVEIWMSPGAGVSDHGSRQDRVPEAPAQVSRLRIAALSVASVTALTAVILVSVHSLIHRAPESPWRGADWQWISSALEIDCGRAVESETVSGCRAGRLGGATVDVEAVTREHGTWFYLGFDPESHDSVTVGAFADRESAAAYNRLRGAHGHVVDDHVVWVGNPRGKNAVAAMDALRAAHHE